MKLLRDVELFCIKVDYLMWSEEKGEYTEPVYLSIDTETMRKDGTCVNLIFFEEKITPRLRPDMCASARCAGSIFKRAYCFRASSATCLWILSGL